MLAVRLMDVLNRTSTSLFSLPTSGIEWSLIRITATPPPPIPRHPFKTVISFASLSSRLVERRLQPDRDHYAFTAASGAGRPPAAGHPASERNEVTSMQGKRFTEPRPQRPRKIEGEQESAISLLDCARINQSQQLSLN